MYKLNNGLTIFNNINKRDHKFIKLFINVGVKNENMNTSGTIFRLQEIWRHRFGKVLGEKQADFHYDHDIFTITVDDVDDVEDEKITSILSLFQSLLDTPLTYTDFKHYLKSTSIAPKNLFL